MEWYPFIMLIVIFALYFWNAEVRKGSLKTAQPYFTSTFITELPPYRTFKVIMQYATNSSFRINDSDEKTLAMILNERMTLMSCGSLYPIHVREEVGRTIVEVGVTSKFGKGILMRPINKKLLTLRLERIFNDVKSAVYAYELRNEMK
jgi:hypothetical protein